MSANGTADPASADELRRAYGLLDGITGGTKDLIAALDNDFRFTYFNAAYQNEFRRLWNCTIERGTSLLEAMAPWPAEQARARKLWQRAMDGESFRVTEAFGPSPEETQYYDLEFNPVRVGEFGQVGAAHILRNVTERVRMQAELEQREARLRDSESFYRQVIESVPGMTFSCDADGYCHYLSEQWSEYTGIPTAELLGHQWPRCIHEEERDAVVAAFTRSVARVEPYDIEYRIIRADGVAEWFKVRGHALFKADGGVARWIGTAVNVENLKRAEALLQEADRRKDEFLTTLAHELRNPLGPLHSVLDVLREGRGSAESLERVLPIMERQLNQLTRMVDDLLDAGRANRGQVTLKKSNVDLCEVLRDVVSAVRIDHACGRRSIELVLGRDPIPLRADRVRLAQVFGNLLGNAVKFTGDDGRIVIRARCAGGRVKVSVRDDGIGIERGLLDRVFNLFTQAEPGRSGGLGIGLSLVRSLVRDHGGHVEAHSAGPGRGTEILVTLPVRADAVAPGRGA